MTLHFRHRPAALLVWTQQHDHSLLTCEREYKTVTEAIGAGLAIQQVWYKPGWTLYNDYVIVHSASGTLLLHNTVPTQYDYHQLVTGQRLLPEEEWDGAESHTGEGMNQA